MRIPLILGGAALALAFTAGMAGADTTMHNHGHTGSATLVADASHDTITVDGAFVRQSVGKMGASGAFMTLHNHGHHADRLTGAGTPVAGKAEIHRTSVGADGVMKMRPVAVVDVPAGGMVELKPGGLHVMLMHLKEELKPGMEIPLTLTFEKAGDVTVTIPVMPIGHGAAGHGAMNHGTHGSMEAGASNSGQ